MSILNTSPWAISLGSFMLARASTTSSELAVRTVTGPSTASGKSCQVPSWIMMPLPGGRTKQRTSSRSGVSMPRWWVGLPRTMANGWSPRPTNSWVMFMWRSSQVTSAGRRWMRAERMTQRPLHLNAKLWPSSTAPL
ncbi:hypothetical protein OV079_41395 [Nannocystis pusilla]|uniref:Uncharacterized protein n=1 Tax=Nannocystis pusilla TaxID=889268 RepID=A0A9X3EYP2_9BACT|nr:hypothetical protein [Nannocystis pusilla]MCY1011904.1 hypothetical protein [Nannocystis pusilla]